ncbi:ComEC/Rec2 family competence protein [uncultured Corynebacterium sp.]|uniref:ComEC/Rec2 family competence protein n=1 Tax=uncultured Corynebacterium sp. TaxID=159447 RepID=UPI0025995B97|nr:ComEC/Rec2 family competence protein [uncultured Corynebacterium sp.]
MSPPNSLLSQLRSPTSRGAQSATHAQRALRDPHSPEAIRERRGLDFRLLPSAALMWVGVASTIITRSGWPLTILVVLSLAVSFIRMRAWQPVHVWRTANVALICGSLAAACAYLRVLLLDATPVLQQLHRGGKPRLVGEYSVAGTPRQIAEGGVLLPIDVPQLGSVPMFLSAERSHSAGEHSVDALDLQPGQRVQISGTLELSDRPGLVPVVMRGERAPELTADPGPDGIWACTAWLRNGLRWAVAELPSDVGGLIPGMVVGDTSEQSPQAQGWFVSTGLSHLTAVSGSNVAAVVGSVLVICAFIGLQRKATATVCALALVGFVLVVGPEPSVLRAAVMGSVGIVAVATVRWSDVVAALGSAVIVLMLFAPGMAVSYGFGLSVVATIGIVLCAPWMSTRLLRSWTHRCDDWWSRQPSKGEAALVRLVCVSLAADMVTAPVLVLMTGAVSTTSVVANLLVSWCVPPITAMGLFIAPLGGSISALGTPTEVSWILGGLLLPLGWWIMTVAEQLSQVPRVITPGGLLWSIAWAAITALGVGSIYWIRQWRMWRWPWLCIAVVLGMTLQWELPAERRGEGDVPAQINVSGKVVMEVTDDEQAVALHGLDPQRTVIVVSGCGRPHDRPTFSKEGVPVVYPCRDGTELTGQ